MATYDYTNFYKLFAPMIKQRTDLQMIELNTNGKMPAPPFVTFDIVSPYIPSGFLEDNRYFEAVVSFTVYAKQKLDALNRAEELRNILGDQTARDAAEKLDIIIVERMPLQVRSVQETTNFAYMNGFDVRLRTSYSEEVKGEISGVQIHQEEQKDGK